MELVYLVASVPSIKSASISSSRFSSPSTGFVCLIPDVSTYIPILLTLDFVFSAFDSSISNFSIILLSLYFSINNEFKLFIFFSIPSISIFLLLIITSPIPLSLNTFIFTESSANPFSPSIILLFFILVFAIIVELFGTFGAVDEAYSSISPFLDNQTPVPLFTNILIVP